MNSLYSYLQLKQVLRKVVSRASFYLLLHWMKKQRSRKEKCKDFLLHYCLTLLHVRSQIYVLILVYAFVRVPFNQVASRVTPARVNLAVAPSLTRDKHQLQQQLSGDSKEAQQNRIREKSTAKLAENKLYSLVKLTASFSTIPSKQTLHIQVSSLAHYISSQYVVQQN